mmetsp:Transcript_37797/g.112832  ORF Transcript_37797/g.112832 Transcript_37797/m.112832 type:complete len:360 (+) Transcript_37797:266-1345(+)
MRAPSRAMHKAAKSSNWSDEFPRPLPPATVTPSSFPMVKRCTRRLSASATRMEPSGQTVTARGVFSWLAPFPGPWLPATVTPSVEPGRNICTRWFSVSATSTESLGPMARPRGYLSSSGPQPRSPVPATVVPKRFPRVKRWTRWFPESVTRKEPSLAMTTAAGQSNWSASSPAPRPPATVTPAMEPSFTRWMRWLPVSAMSSEPSRQIATDSGYLSWSAFDPGVPPVPATVMPEEEPFANRWMRWLSLSAMYMTPSAVTLMSQGLENRSGRHPAPWPPAIAVADAWKPTTTGFKNSQITPSTSSLILCLQGWASHSCRRATARAWQRAPPLCTGCMRLRRRGNPGMLGFVMAMQPPGLQ